MRGDPAARERADRRAPDGAAGRPDRRRLREGRRHLRQLPSGGFGARRSHDRADSRQRMPARLVLNPATPVDWLDWTIDKLDLVLLMAVNRASAAVVHSAHARQAAHRPRLVDAARERTGRDILLEVDGGVKWTTSARSPPRARIRSSPAARSSAAATTRRDDRAARTRAIAEVDGLAMITESEFRARRAGLQPHSAQLETFADLDTPLSLYLKLAQHATRSCSSRSSAASASAAIRSSACRRRSASAPAARASRSRIAAASSSATKAIRSSSCARSRATARRRCPVCRASAEGLAGCFGYDTVRHIEPRLAGALPRRSTSTTCPTSCCS